MPFPAKRLYRVSLRKSLFFATATNASYYYLIKFFNQISRSSCGIFSAKALKIRLMQNLYAPYGAIKTFQNERFL